MKQPTKKGRSFAPALCTVIGTLIMVSVIAFFAPIALQRVCGYTVYHVVSESMEPTIPVGSAIFVFPQEPEHVLADEIIAFQSGGSVVTHRVVQNQTVEGKLITKGDANDSPDPEPVAYGDLIGRVGLHIPLLGAFFELFTTVVGKVYILLYLACGVLFHILASRLRSNRQKPAEESPQ